MIIQFDYLDGNGSRYRTKGTHRFVVAKNSLLLTKDNPAQSIIQLDEEAKRFVRFLRGNTSSVFYRAMLAEGNRIRLLEEI